ncbi:MAG TPA: hypothetical protein VGM18_18220 [Candidatus Sulfotelmatobacter sp.]|jgi:hypothetical protein
MLRMEDKIRKLCAELLATTEDEEVRPILVELRDALHEHVERLRERFASYPFFVERRTGDHIPRTNERPYNERPYEDSAEQAHGPRDQATDRLKLGSL